MTKYRVLYLLGMILVIFSLALTGCVQTAAGGAADPAESDPVQSDVFQVAILLPGPIDDQGWSQAGYEGLKLIEAELGAQVAYSDNVPEDDEEREKIMRQYAEEGFEFIIGHGGEYIAAMETVAEQFPQTQFAVVTSYAGNNRNLGALSIRSDETGYLGGVVAALKTQTNKVAYIGGEVYPSTTEEAAAFEKGVKDTNPAVEVVITWVDSWSDEAKGREVALAQVEAGADVLAVDADIAGLAALEVAENEGVYAIGWVQDQHELAPNAILTSVIQQMSIRLLQGAILVQQGRWEGKQYKFGLQEGVVDLAPFYGMLTPAEEAIIDQVREDIMTGQIELVP